MFTTKRMMFLCGFLVLVGGVAFYLFQQNKLSPEPIASDTVLKLVPKQEIPDETPRVQAGLTGKPPAEDPHAGHNHPPHEHSHDKPEAEISSGETPDAEGADTVAPTNENAEVLSEEAIQKWVTETMKALDDLNTRFMEKYPELLEISQMTKEDFFEKYPTVESRQALLEYVQSVQPEMFAELRAVFSNLPIEIADDILLEAKDHFIQMWGPETADQVMAKLRAELGL